MGRRLCQRNIIALFLTSFFLTANVIADPRPLSVPWDNTKYFGPDGPWQTVQATVGTGDGAVQVNLYPGGGVGSNILTDKFCNGSCAAQASGLYNAIKSPTADYKSITSPGSITGWGADAPMNMTGMGMWVLDTMKIGTGSSAQTLSNMALSTQFWGKNELPNGTTYAPRVGNLGLGCPDPTLKFTAWNGSDVTGQHLTGSLRSSNAIPSSSFGLHIGSVPNGQQGSLILGGYDQSRIVGKVAAYDMTASREPLLRMIDATLGVESGGSPFNGTGNVFRSGGNNAAVSTVLNPLVPYMVLPPGMCDAIAANLPLVALPETGLYAWNLNDPKAWALPNTPAYLAFTFDNANQNLTIKVPFSLLNLTLESPLTSTSRPYFPCLSAEAADGTYHLGRAFLQAAYLAMNWEAKKFFVAQAAGPNSGPASIAAIQPSDTTLTPSASTNTLSSTWQGKWGPLPSNMASQSQSSSSASANSSDPSMATKIGASVGTSVAFCLLLGLLVCILIRLRRRSRSRTPSPLDISGRPQLRYNEKARHNPKSPAAAAALARASVDADYDDDAHGRLAPPGYYRSPTNPHAAEGAFGPTHPAAAAAGNAKFRRDRDRVWRHEMAGHPPAEMDAPGGPHAADRRGPDALHEISPRGEEVAHEIDSTEVWGRSASPRAPRAPPRSASAMGERRRLWLRGDGDDGPWSARPARETESVWSASSHDLTERARDWAAHGRGSGRAGGLREGGHGGHPREHRPRDASRDGGGGAAPGHPRVVRPSIARSSSETGRTHWSGSGWLWPGRTPTDRGVSEATRWPASPRSPMSPLGADDWPPKKF